MIVSAIIWIIYLAVALITSPLRLLSDVSINSNFAQAIITASSYIGTFEKFFPVSTIITILGTILTIEIIIATYKIIMWIIKRFPTQS